MWFSCPVWCGSLDRSSLLCRSGPVRSLDVVPLRGGASAHSGPRWEDFREAKSLWTDCDRLTFDQTSLKLVVKAVCMFPSRGTVVLNRCSPDVCPGTLNDVEHVLVDVGTGYYVEKVTVLSRCFPCLCVQRSAGCRLYGSR